MKSQGKRVLPTPGIGPQQLQSALLRFGVSSGGAYEFMNGFPVSRQEDRNALLALLQQLVQGGGAGRIFGVKIDF